MMDKKLILFFCTHFTYGMLFNIFGPIVPFLAQQSGKIESQFSYIFVIRGISYLLAGFFQQKFLKDYCLYKRMLISCISSGICYILFHLFFQSFWVSAFLSLLLNLSNGSIQILINILLVSQVTGDAKQAIGFSYGFYGMGAVVGSIVVSILGVNALTFCGIWIFTIGMMYFDLVSFRKINKEQVIKQNLLKSQQIKEQKTQQQIKNILNQNLQIYFCHLFLLYAAISLTYRIWMPSFIVMQGLASKQTAAISISIYSAVLTGFRFLFTFWSPQIIKSLNYIASLTILTLLGSLISYYLNLSFLLVFGSSIILGVLFASYMPFLYALPSQFKMTFSQQGVSNTIIYYAIGQAVISAFIGCLMEWFHPIMLFISLFLLSILNKNILEQTIFSLKKDKMEKQNINNKQIQMKTIS